MARPRSEQARTKMLEAGTGLVVEAGVAGFTVDEVARRSGVAKTTIYRHFPSGEELLIACLDGMIAPFPTPDNGNLRDDLTEFITVLFPVMTRSDLRLTMLELMAASARSPELHAVHLAMAEERKAPLREVFDRAMARGEISPDITFDEAFDHIEGPFLSRWMHRPDLMDEMNLDVTIDRIVHLLKG